MTHYAVMDIETAENERAKEYYARKSYEPAANLKDPAKIEQSILAKRQKDMDQAPLHWWTGKVICICANPTTPSSKPFTVYGDNETSVLRTFFDWYWWLCDAHGSVQLIGKSGEYFDIPFIIGRLLALDLGIPEPFRRPIRDIDHIFSFSSQCDQRSNLNDYAWGLGIKAKTMHGSDVAGLYAQIQLGDKDRWNDLAAYCAQDVNIAAEMLRRYEKKFIYRTVEPTKSAEPDLANVF